ncbi:hypothetical protein EON65_31755 [archaeon]|nr:MAG: hypothetical protein EON65_31755 [archaeon]
MFAVSVEEAGRSPAHKAFHHSSKCVPCVVAGVLCMEAGRIQSMMCYYHSVYVLCVCDLVLLLTLGTTL